METNDRKIPAIILKMTSMKEDFSKSEQKVVDYIIQNPEKVIYLSVAELAENSAVSDPTVVRACQKMGMSGYQALKLALARDIVSPLQSIHEDVKENDSVKAISDKVFQSAYHALEFTHDTMNVADIERAAECLMKAPKILAFGMGNSNAIAIDFQHKMMRLGCDATAYSDSHMAAIAASYAKPGDAVFAVSHSGSSRDVVENAQIAKSLGATVISLSNVGKSPLTKISDICLYTASNETHYRILALSSRIAQMTIIDTLYTVIAMRKKCVASDFRKLEEALGMKKY